MPILINKQKLTRALVLFSNIQCRKSNIFSPVRYKAHFATTLRINNINGKKEPHQIYKWILLLIPVGSCGLGSWQVHRLNWKINLIERMQSKTSAHPVEIPKDFIDLEKMEYTPVKVKGHFLHEKEILIGPRALIDESSAMNRVGSLVSDPKKNQGWLVVTPFKLVDSGEVILINRGWIHQNQRPREKRAPSYLKGEVELVGVVRLTEKRSPFMPKNHPEKGSWFYRDLKQMSECIGCAPVWLDARGDPEPPEGWPIPNQTRITLRNEHLSYIVTWYSLSALTAIMWHRYFWRKLPLL